MKLDRRLVLLAVLFLLASPLIAADVTGVIQGQVDCGKRCEEILVYLEGLEGSFSGREANVTFDQKDKVFQPHILPVVKGTTVRMLNSDPFLHNIHAYAGKRGLFNLAIPANTEPVERVFEETGKHTILCDVHPEMSAYIVVLDNPFFSTVSEDGGFEIGNVPAGSYTAVLYHPKRDRQLKQSVEVQSGPVQLEFQTGKKKR